MVVRRHNNKLAVVAAGAVVAARAVIVARAAVVTKYDFTFKIKYNAIVNRITLLIN
jgi:hypothetical protein